MKDWIQNNYKDEGNLIYNQLYEIITEIWHQFFDEAILHWLSREVQE